MDWEERNDAFYNDVCIIYDGMIPPGLEGFPQNGNAPVSYRGADLERAKELLANAGYPNGEGLPTLNYYSSREATGQQMAEMTARQLRRIGIKINPRLDDFSSFMEVVNKKNAPFFSFAWGWASRSCGFLPRKQGLHVVRHNPLDIVVPEHRIHGLDEPAAVFLRIPRRAERHLLGFEESRINAWAV